MDSNGQKRGPEAEDEQLISIGSNTKKAKIFDPSGICYRITNVSAEPLICSRSKCIEGKDKNGTVVSFSVKPNGNSYYKECDECRKHTAEKNPKTNLKVSLHHSQPQFPS
jgi:hypothetical protein